MRLIKNIEDMYTFKWKLGEGQFGTDESELNVIFATRSYDHLRAVFEAYEGIADGKTMEEAISSECSGTLEDGFMAIGENVIELGYSGMH